MQHRFDLVKEQTRPADTLRRYGAVIALLGGGLFVAWLALSLLAVTHWDRTQRAAQTNARATVQAAFAAHLAPATPAPTPTAITPYHTRTNRVAQLYSGPGIYYAKRGVMGAEQPVTLVGANRWYDWFQLDNGLWIAKPFVQESTRALPVTAP